MAAISKDGTESVARSPHSGRCSAFNAKGNPCGAWSLPGEDFCYLHSLTPEERHDQAREGGKTRVRNVHRRKAIEALQPSGPRVSRDKHQEALEQLKQADEKLRQLVREGRLSESELPRYYRTV